MEMDDSYTLLAIISTEKQRDVTCRTGDVPTDPGNIAKPSVA
jgi:hypothetical protein